MSEPTSPRPGPSAGPSAGPPAFELPLPASSEAAALLARVDWEATPLGPVAQWPHALRTAVVIALHSRFAMGVLWGPDSVQLYNDSYVPILGRKHPVAMGQSARDCWPELWSTIGPMFESVRQTGQAVWFEDLRMDIDRQGRLQEGYFTFSYSPITGEGHRVEGIFVSAHETTDSVLNVRRQRSLRELAKAAVEGSSALEVVRACMAPLAANPNDLPSVAVYLRPPGAAQLQWAAGYGALEAPPAAGVPAPGAREHSQVLPIRCSGSEPVLGLLEVALNPLRPLDEAYQHYLTQVAEHLGAALTRVEAFERTRREHIAVLERMTDGFYALDARGRVTYVNAAAERMLRRGREEMLGQDLERLFPAGLGTTFEVELRRAMREQVPVQFEASSVVARGSWVEVHAYPSPAGLSVFFRDVSERRLSAQRLQESEARYRSVFEHSPLPMWLFEPETLAFLEVNEAAEAAYGYSREEFLRMTLRDIRPAEELPRLDAALEGARVGPRFTTPAVHRCKDGRLLQVELSVDALLIGGRRVHLAVAHDVTERRRLEAQLRQAQKMEAVGQLAGGIAHDFNNLLAVMGTYSRGALEAVPAEGELHEDLQEVVRAVDRAAGLTRQLLAFSRNQSLVLEPLDLNQVVRDAERMLRRVIREDIQLVTVLAPDLELVHADRSQLEQMLLNLAVNARDAMPAGGTLTLETAPPVLRDGGVPGLRAGRYARLVVRDTGHGMDERTRQRIFEPFFTTKPVGKGTGLGLAMVYGVLEQLGGHAEVESSPGQGTAFTLLLPLGAGQPEEAPEAPAPEVPGDLQGSETVLVVEDEPAVRQSLRRLLQRRGYRVLEACEGQEALQVLERCPVQMVLTDLVMPVMGGRALAARVRERWPRLPVLFVSGYDPDGADAGGGADVISKPFTGDELLRRLRAALA